MEKIVQARNAAWAPPQDIIRDQKDLFATLGIQKRKLTPATHAPPKKSGC